MTDSDEGTGLKYVDLADKHLDGLQDPTLLILKGHLLVEELLYEHLRDALQHPAHLDDANLRFQQLMSIARATLSLRLSSESDNDRVWEAVAALNTIRNRMAHRLEPAELGDLLPRLLVVTPYEFNSLNDPGLPRALHHAFGFLLAALSTLSLDPKIYEPRPPTNETVEC